LAGGAADSALEPDVYSSSRIPNVNYFTPYPKMNPEGTDPLFNKKERKVAPIRPRIERFEGCRSAPGTIDVRIDRGLVSIGIEKSIPAVGNPGK
jgi:hypothetical protein